MFNPVTTYRIQFHKEFTFQHFDVIIPYLQKLGVKTIYASPIFEAVPGSNHGYDVVNPYRINPEIGTEEQLQLLSRKLKEQGINWIQDIVPNHMAFHPSNIWLMDVLEKGTLSAYASFFDVTWTSPLFHGRLMAPFLGGSLEEVIQKKEIQVVYEHQRLVLNYFDQHYPLHPRTYKTLLKCVARHPSNEVQLLIDQLQEIPQITDPINYAFRWHEFLMQLASQMKGDSNTYINECINAVNQSPEQLRQIADAQVYRLCSWEETNGRINYRRFFTVNGLICLNMQSEEVFRHYHQKIKSLLEEGIIQGLRVDHVDGLYDPAQYLERLRQLAGADTYIVVEKILEPGEKLPSSWPVQGTTGYDFLGIVNNVFTKTSTEKVLSKFYSSLVHDKRTTYDKIVDKKNYILHRQMGGELDNLYQFFVESDLVSHEVLEQMKPEDLRQAIAEFLIQCPVYRYYGNRFPLPQEEYQAVKEIFRLSRKHKPKLSEALDVLERALFQSNENSDDQSKATAIHFYQRCMQFTGPLMAKGVEDTLMYTFNRFVGHNEVGDSPEFFGLTTSDFHQKMKDRQRYDPLSMNATSTHDTKRGEDVRSRLNVLTELAAEWIETVQKWRQLNEECKTNDAPDANDEYFIYQTLVGAYPMQEEEDFITRLEEYLTKALREGKRLSDWAHPNEEYEKAVLSFVRRILDHNRFFYKSFIAFQKKVSDHGIINSLSQVLLKFTCPGVPDSYQGSASWDLSLVDPDNRRLINYEQREYWLDDLLSTQRTDELIGQLWKAREDSRIKLWLVHTLMSLRSGHPEVFREGFYIPLEVTGKYKENIVAYARTYKRTWYVIAVPLYTAQLCKQQKKEIDALNWKDTCIQLPAEAPLLWKHLLSDAKGKVKKGIAIKAVFKQVPFALLQLEETEQDRSAGVLLSITSLPSSYGIGDLGKEARNFAASLNRARQLYWQLLPLNPVTKESHYSPYSSFSSRAGNILLISPEELMEEGFLTKQELEEQELPVTSEVNYEEAEQNKKFLLEKAWASFQGSKSLFQQSEFDSFIEKESYWLDDFALYVILKNKNEQRPWYEWPEEWKCRDPKAIEIFAKQYPEELAQVKWYQFVFFQQWKKLRHYCNALGVKLFGDLPFYVSHDSADVWSHPDIFNLDEAGKMKGSAGVSPDYFNSNGQLWGMPVFQWDVMREQKYAWWIARVCKNMELYDVLRFDHFRAFVSYWEVPAGETTAINGSWKSGPGADFFEHLKQKIGSLPFIAEDLGEITPDVYALRDQYGLRGMKILQYAFDESMSTSIFIPHQFSSAFVVYTGTHDNNTTRGWYRENTTKEDRRRIESYLGHKVKEKNIAEALMRLAYSSVAEIVIVPLQDILNLDESARMNTPSSTEKNWSWRLKSHQFTSDMENSLREWTRIYGR